MNTEAELQPFARLIEALTPWLDQVVIIGGWAHRLYRLDARAENLTYPPLTTLDSDIAVPAKIQVKETSIRERLLASGFQEEFIGEDRPPATHYHLGEQRGFYAEFLTPLVGGEYDREGALRATEKIGGVSSQRLRYVDILLVRPWSVRLDQSNGYPLVEAKVVQIANPASFLAQKILIQELRDRRDRAKDALYIHDTIETFAAILPELREISATEILPKLHLKKQAEIKNAAEALFGAVNDTIREAVLMAPGRRLSAEAVVETCRAGLGDIFA